MKASLGVTAFLISCGVFVVSARSDDYCTPGTTWKEDCNDCFCNDEGRPMCTQVNCPGDAYDEDTQSVIACTPGMKFKIKCNDCVCGADGRSAYCTMMACPDDGWMPFEPFQPFQPFQPLF